MTVLFSWCTGRVLKKTREMETATLVNKRSLSDIDAVLEFAKLERDEIKTVTQSIHFSENLDSDHIKLVELDNHILTALENGEKVVIRGDKEDSAVLCTDGRTYDVKQGEVSNAMLLVPELIPGANLPDTGPAEVAYRDVCCVMQTFLEMRPCKPHLQKLRALLGENPYSGEASEGDEEHQGVKYTLTDLLSLVQASETEIMGALHQLQALIIKGYWRVLDFDFLVQVLAHIIQLCEENGWMDKGIPIEECVSVLEELFPRNVIESVVKSFCDKIVPNNNEEEEESMQIDIDYYRPNEDKVCRFYAEQILKHARKFNLSQFLTTWEKSVPEPLKTSLYQLEGLALVDRSSSPEVISYLPVETLPETINERFDFLFRTKEKWSLEEIKPYIKDLQTDKMNVTAMLTKFARASQSNGVRVYNSRKPLS